MYTYTYTYSLIINVNTFSVKLDSIVLSSFIHNPLKECDDFYHISMMHMLIVHIRDQQSSLRRFRITILFIKVYMARILSVICHCQEELRAYENFLVLPRIESGISGIAISYAASYVRALEYIIFSIFFHNSLNINLKIVI